MKSRNLKKSLKNIIFVMTVTAVIVLSLMTGCSGQYDLPSEDDMIQVIIKLDLKEDIGLFLTEWDINGQKGGSGSSNADRSMLKHDDILDWSFDRQFLEVPADTVDLTLRFIVVTKYFEPRYDFDYPEEYMIPMDPISLTADFGETYSVTVTGDSVNGYTAVLNEQ